MEKLFIYQTRILKVKEFMIFYFCRVKTDIHDLVKEINFSQEIDINNLKTIFFTKILKAVSVTLEVVGYVSNDSLVKMIEEGYILASEFDS